MLIKELKTDCAACQGKGVVAGFNQLGIRQINREGRCPTCRGRGWLPSPLGADLAAFLAPLLEESQQARLETLSQKLAQLEGRLETLAKRLDKLERDR